MRGIFVLLLFFIIPIDTLFAFEDARVLPEGVRRVSIKGVSAEVIGRANEAGQISDLSASLNKPLKFSDMVESKNGTERSLLAGYLRANSFGEDESAGYFDADVASQVNVVAPIFGFGITKRLTIGLAIPYYRAQSKVALGFKYSPRGRDLVKGMQGEGRSAEAKEVALGLNQAVTRLQQKLNNAGYESIESWSGDGIGDVTLMAKYHALDYRKFRIASQSGFVLPTGRRDDPNQLSDVPFGDGSLDLFVGAMTDYVFDRHFLFNLTYKYSAQMRQRVNGRIGTRDDPLTAEQSSVSFDSGDKDAIDSSLQYQSSAGILAGAGVIRERRFQHRDIESGKGQLIGKEGEYTEMSQWRLGYSTVDAYLRGKALAPTSITLTMLRNLKAKNIAVSNRIELDMNVFF